MTKFGDFYGFCIVYLTSDLEVKGLSGQDQRPHGSRSKVTVANKGRWAHINVKLLHINIGTPSHYTCSGVVKYVLESESVGIPWLQIITATKSYYFY